MPGNIITFKCSTSGKQIFHLHEYPSRNSKVLWDRRQFFLFYGNSLDVAGYLALGSKKANGNDRRDRGWRWWWTWSFEKSGEYLKQSPWGLAWETLVTELMGDVGKPVWNMTMYLVYTVILFFPAAFVNLVIGSSKGIRLAVEITSKLRHLQADGMCSPQTKEVRNLCREGAQGMKLKSNSKWKWRQERFGTGKADVRVSWKFHPGQGAHLRTCWLEEWKQKVVERQRLDLFTKLLVAQG